MYSNFIHLQWTHSLLPTYCSQHKRTSHLKMRVTPNACKISHSVRNTVPFRRYRYPRKWKLTGRLFWKTVAASPKHICGNLLQEKKSGSKSRRPTEHWRIRWDLCASRWSMLSTKQQRIVLSISIKSMRRCIAPHV